MFSTRRKSESTSAPSQPPLSPPWTELPHNLTANILQRLHTEEIVMSVQLVCSTWWRFCKNNPSIWRVIDLDIRRCRATRHFRNICRCHEAVCSSDCELDTCIVICRCILNKFKNVCRFAVDRSQGQLVELKLAGVDVDEFLSYVIQPQRSSQLRCLTIVEYSRNDEPGSTPLTELIIKLPQLEELHLFMKPWVDPKDFETIGIACPMLKSFTHHNCFFKDLLDFVEYTTAIGKTMPNLRHLRLCQNLTGDKVLEPILDGCPKLKSLDLRRCSAFDYPRGKRCSDQIKELWLQSDSVSFRNWIKEWQHNHDSEHNHDIEHNFDHGWEFACYHETTCNVLDWNFYHFC